MGKKLSLKEKRFVDAYLGEAAGNATLAVEMAGYKQTYQARRTTGKRMLTKAHIKAAIKRRTTAEERVSILTADQRDEWLTRIVTSKASPKDKIAAIKELNKVTGRHSVNINLKGKVTLEQILGESRK